MDIEEYFELIEESSPADWLVPERQPYLVDIVQCRGLGQPVPWLEADKPDSHYVFRENLSISMVKGRKHLDHFQEDWCANFPHHQPRSGFIDFLFNGSLVHTALYVVVDGGRCCLPCPGPLDMEVAERYANVMRLVHHLDGAGAYQFDDYLARSGARVVEAQWPPQREGW